MGKLLSENQLNWFQQIFFERFGVKFIFEKREDCIVLKYKESEKLIIFSNMDKEFYAFGETGLNCYEWNSEKEGMQGIISPILKAPSTKALPSTLINFNEKGAEINYDILGLTYWMLNRLEEIHRTDLDNHERFPAINSHAYKYDYLERPIVDEWLYILQQVINKIWPDISLKKNKYKLVISHDVDFPSLCNGLNTRQILKLIIVELIKNKDFKKAFSILYIYLSGFIKHNTLHQMDPFNTFDYLMCVSEKYNLKSSFYFIGDITDPSKDCRYKLSDEYIVNLMSNIYNRGHEIGLHPSYNSYKQSKQILKEFNNLKEICEKNGFNYKKYGGRMHYLRWKHPHTLQEWDDAGLDYDSTLGYADLPGFRCGTCFEYTSYNPVNDKLLNIKIRPLIVMDGTIISRHYLNLGYTNEAIERILSLKDTCYKVGGNFTFLWHNSFFKDKFSHNFYEKVISKSLS